MRNMSEQNPETPKKEKKSWLGSLKDSVLHNQNEELNKEIITAIKDSSEKADSQKPESQRTIRLYVILSYVAKVAIGYLSYLKLQAILNSANPILELFM